MKAYLERPEDTTARLKVDPARGLDAAQRAESEAQYGKNILTKEKPISFWRRLLTAAKEPMTLILIFAGLIAFGVNIVRAVTGEPTEFVECIGIFLAIFLSIAITVVMEGRSAKAFEALNRLQDDTEIRCLRDGEVQKVPQKELLVGDILLVETGNRIPVDARLLESVDLSLDESSLTGESLPVDKEASVVYVSEKQPVAERANMLYAGSFVTGGSGKAIVTEVGDRTEFGKIAQELSGTDTSTTPLQEKLAKLGSVIAVLGSIVAAIVFVIQVVRICMQGSFDLAAVTEAFITSIALIVASVPEGLPTIVAIALAINIIKMSKQNALVKKMVACETIGSINVICSDKTGTLTENRMTVKAVCPAEGQAIQPEELDKPELLTNFAVNSTADVAFSQEGANFIGNPTECALLVACHKAGKEYKALREAADIVRAYPFSSETKKMTTVLRAEEGYAVYSKGSPEKILEMCAMPDEARQAAEAEIQAYQAKAYRVLGFAHKYCTEADADAERETVESGLTYDGFVVITDPLRSDVYAAVARCREAGIDIKMLTGDHIVTAKAIAEELGILDDAHIAVEASTLEDLSDQAFLEILPKIRVIARSTPLIKMRVVKGLKQLGNVVAVTGDGINDAPAIKNADVGVAMGITGTEVSKAAADIVLLDDAFSTIVKAVQWGRGIYENFQRFIQFQLTVNLASVLFVLAAVLFGFASPFSALELLWINLIMDGPPALTLGLEPIRSDLMKRQPTPRGSSIVTRSMLARIVLCGLYMTLVMLAQLKLNFIGGTPEQANTILFTLFVVFQLMNAFNNRELGTQSIFRNFTRNKSMLLVFAGTLLLQVIITQFGGFMFGTVPLGLAVWGKIFLTAFSIILVSELLKLILRLVQRARS